MLVVALVVGSFVLVNVLLEIKLASADRVAVTLFDTPSGGGANYLLIGSDTRAFVSDPQDAEAFGDEGDAGGQRSDTIMVLHTDPDSGRALLVSFPRDLWVDIPGVGGARLNAAFNNGPQALIDTLAANFDVPIQHYVEVDFDSFRGIVDAVGSVPVYFPTPARDALSNLDVPVAGCIELDGAGALSFVRSRHLELFDPASGEWFDADSIPDLGRIGRQQAFLREVGKRGMDAALTNPLKANDIIDQGVGLLTLDNDFGRGDVFNLAHAFAGENGDVASGPESLTVPAVPATRGGQSVLLATTDADAVFERLRDFDAVVPSLDAGDATPDDTVVRVLNASGATGAAATALASLEAQGFGGADTGNADAPLSTTEIHHQPGGEDKANLLATYVTGPVELVEDDTVEGADVTLYIGDTFEGIVTPAAAPAPDAVPAQSTSLAPVPGGC